MSKKLKDDQCLENDLITISEEIGKLEKSTKLKDILKRHKDVKTQISIATEKIILLQKNFELNIDDQKDLIDDETYEKYSKEITEISKLDVENYSIEALIKKYKSISKKIICCENYLKSKKIEITYCDKNEDE